MYDDLIKRLRERSVFLFPHHGESRSYDSDLMHEAADAIEKLVGLLRKAAADTTFDAMQAVKLQVVLPQWISVEDRLPEENQIVVAVESGRTWDYGQFRGLAYPDGNKHKWNWKKNITKTVDYWMLKKDALPEPPKEEK